MCSRFVNTIVSTDVVLKFYLVIALYDQGRIEMRVLGGAVPGPPPVGGPSRRNNLTSDLCRISYHQGLVISIVFEQQ